MILAGLGVTGIVVYGILQSRDVGLGILLVVIIVPILLVTLVLTLTPKSMRPGNVTPEPRSFRKKITRAILFWVFLLAGGGILLVGFAWVMGYLNIALS